MHVSDIETLIQQYGKDIYKFCYMLTGSKADSDDLYQDTFLKAVEKACELNPELNPKAYLLATAAGIWKSRRRKLARRNRIAPNQAWDEALELPGLQQAGAEETALLRMEQVHVRQAVAKLSVRLKLPLYLHYGAGMSMEEIGTALKLPAGTVKSRLHKGRQELRKGLEGML